MNKEDVRMFPKKHPWYDIIVWDSNAKQYYNRRTDIYLSDDDITYYQLPKEGPSCPAVPTATDPTTLSQCTNS